ncbi:bifunctional lytic transglycosylase/C40 family peptidase [Actinomadura sp. NBRC 104412]|uniref:C40 family peptidase n=1 Tax=Actinomadura sp. NBRC 104412 TaxID=3032203 RepID=UPI002553159E|nr:bifunctional lytic transglycosylase/C40 family peptidase [Actinomadura sp. NBRC 104412]
MLLSAFLGAGFALSPLNPLGMPHAPADEPPGKSRVDCQPAATEKAKSDIPDDYFALYKEMAAKEGIGWDLLAAIGKIESDHGRSPLRGVRSGRNSAGAAGPMQFGIGGRAGNTWGGAPRHRADGSPHGADGNGDGWEDVYDPADAILAAARYLKAHGLPGDVREALFAYNHSEEYVDKVLDQAVAYGIGGAFINEAKKKPDCGKVASKRVRRIIDYALAQQGKPYLWGAEGPKAFDCSGLTLRAYQAAGIQIPRVSWDQYSKGPRVDRAEPGDLVFFDLGPGSRPGHPGHVGIVAGYGRMIVAPSSGSHVQIQSYTVGSFKAALEGFTRPK